MKIRNGFVSNSSSSSFILISKEIGEVSKPERWDKNIHISYNGDVNYCRSDIMEIRTVKEKLKYITALYALSITRCENTPFEEYIRTMDEYVNKISDIALKYGYHTYIEPPAMRGTMKTEKWDDVSYSSVKCDPHVETYIDVYTECNYIDEIRRMVEDSDTSRLESFLFSDKSFGILGGDEYNETEVLRFFARKDVDYPYEIIGEYTDDWGSVIPDYYDTDHIPRYSEDYGQMNLPFEKTDDCGESHCTRCDNERCRYNKSVFCYRQMKYVFEIEGNHPCDGCTGGIFGHIEKRICDTCGVEEPVIDEEITDES